MAQGGGSVGMHMDFYICYQLQLHNSPLYYYSMLNKHISLLFFFFNLSAMIKALRLSALISRYKPPTSCTAEIGNLQLPLVEKAEGKLTIYFLLALLFTASSSNGTTKVGPTIN